MAKLRLNILCLFGLLCFVTLHSGEEYAPDPTLQDIQKMDAWEGNPRAYIPRKAGGYDVEENNLDLQKEIEAKEKTANPTDDNRSQVQRGSNIQNVKDKDLSKRATEETIIEEADFEHKPEKEYINEQEMEPVSGEEPREKELDIYESEDEILIKHVEQQEKEEYEREHKVDIDENNPISEDNGLEQEQIEAHKDNYILGDIDNRIISLLETEEQQLFDINEDLVEENEFESEKETTQRQFEVSSNENLKEDREEEIDTQLTDADSNQDVPEYLTGSTYKQKGYETPLNPIPTENVDVKCYLPQKTGFCKAYFQRFYYNHNSGECEKFIYGGCGGNDNNFQTLNECIQTCSQESVENL